MKLIDKHIPELYSLCDLYYVSELFVFGSVANGKYTEKSDIDFLVKFEGVNPIEYFDNYMDFKDNLSKLFSRDIDLVEIQTIKNPILKRSIDRDKIQIYGRENSKVAV